MKNRIDIELVNRKLFTTRNKAVIAIKNKNIYCNNKLVLKPGLLINEEDLITIIGNIMNYVSKGGLKLEKAIKEFNLNLKNKNLVDIGSSTGGFTDCALQNEVNSVIAVDVGSNQLDKSLQNNQKIKLYEQTDFRNVDINLLKNVNIATIDVSFISVIKLLDKIKQIDTLTEIICLIKPQFECGKVIADKYKGIILNMDVHKNIINNVISEFKKINFNCQGLIYSPIKGGDGNIEYLVYVVKNLPPKIINIDNIVKEAFVNLKNIAK